MKMIIDVPEETYKNLQKRSTEIQAEGYLLENLVLNGTQLPKGHGYDVLDKIKCYVDHIRNTGMGKKKSLEFIEKFIEGLKSGSEEEK